MSEPFDTRELLGWTGGRSLGPERAVTYRGVSIDTRSVAKGQLFVAIRGERHDAHDFLEAALAAGAAGLLIDEAFAARLPAAAAGVAVVTVPDTTRALGALAAGHRARFGGPVVAITGSNGKTTTKEMCHAILSQAGPCLKNKGNLNNEFGLPLTLLAREADQIAAVVELGMNHRGEIARLAAIARPTVGVLTNVGTAHIEFLGSREAIAEEKGDLIAALPASGVAVLNRDDERVVAQARRAAGRVLYYGREPGADVGATAIRFDGEAFCFELTTPAGGCSVRVPGLGETTVINALAAAAAALAAGHSLEHVAAGLALHQPVAGRMALRRLPGGARLIDDSYNANPQSMRAALESLARLKGEGRGIAVLGDMGELGDAAGAAHREIGELAARLGTDLLFALGERAGLLSAAAIEAGMDPECVRIEKDHAELGRNLRVLLRPGDWVLVKGSRSMRMERVVEALACEEAH